MTTLFAVQNPDVFRENVRKKIEPIVEDETNATNLEKAIYNYTIKEATSRKIIKKWDNPFFAQLYLDRLRTIYFNLKKPELLEQIKNGEIAPQTLAFMTHQEMDPAHWKELIDKKMKRDASKFNSNVEASTDMYTCRKCKSKRSTFYEMQTRSADEPATIFVTCLDCGKMSKH
jgi:DNA-directed RNA polymerase subunit M/transcription elongation factor TFIIS